MRSSYVIHLLPHFYVDFFKIYFSWCLLFTWRPIRLVWLAHASLIKFSARSRSATVAFVFCDWLSMRAFCLTATGVLNASWGTGTSPRAYTRVCAFTELTRFCFAPGVGPTRCLASQPTWPDFDVSSRNTGFVLSSSPSPLPYSVRSLSLLPPFQLSPSLLVPVLDICRRC